MSQVIASFAAFTLFQHLKLSTNAGKIIYILISLSWICYLQRYVIKFVSDLRQVGGFLRVLWKVALNTKTQTLYDYIIYRCKKFGRLWIKYFTVGIMFQYGKYINWCSIRLLLIIFWKSVTFMINESLYYSLSWICY
jgi:hypothetical protein